MAFTAAEVNAIKVYLGYDLASTDLDGRLGAVNADGQTTVRTILAQLAAIDTQIGTARGRRKASQVGEVTLNKAELRDLTAERRRVSGELGTSLGVLARSTSDVGQVIV